MNMMTHEHTLVSHERMSHESYAHDSYMYSFSNLLFGDAMQSGYNNVPSHCMCVCALQQSNATSGNGTLPGVLPDQRIVVTSTGLQTDGGDSANITGASAYDRISSIEDDALGTNITSPYKRLIRCYTATMMTSLIVLLF